MLQLQREVSLPNVVVALQILDRRRIDDLAFVDDRDMASQPEAEMHILLRDQHRRTGAAQLPQQFTYPLHDDRGEAFAGFIQQQQRRISHQRAGDRKHLLFATRKPPGDPVPERLEQWKYIVDALDWPLVLPV